MGDTINWRIARTRLKAFSFVQSLMGMEKGINFSSLEGNGLLKGWTILMDKLRGLGIKGKIEKGDEKFLKGVSRAVSVSTQVPALAEGIRSKGLANVAWVNVGDCMTKGPLGVLKYCLVGSWKKPLDPSPTVLEVEKWARRPWHLKGNLMVVHLSSDLLFFEFADPEDVKWVFEVGRRSFRGSSLHLEWWNPEVREKKRDGEGSLDSCGRSPFAFVEKRVF